MDKLHQKKKIKTIQTRRYIIELSIRIVIRKTIMPINVFILKKNQKTNLKFDNLFINS